MPDGLIARFLGRCRPGAPLPGRTARIRGAVLCALWVACITGAARAQGPDAPAPAPAAPAESGAARAAVRVEGRRILEVTSTTPQEAAARADRISLRLQNLIARNTPVRPFTRADLVEQGEQTLITLGGTEIMAVSEADADDALETRRQLAYIWGMRLATAVADARAARANPLRGAGIVIRNSFKDLLVSSAAWLPRLAAAVLLWVLFWLLARFVRWVVSAVTPRLGLDANLRQLLRAVAYYGAWVVGIVTILSTLGLDSTSIATGLGISGFVLGFAFKDILSHFFAGMMLLIGRQFNIGDQIRVGEFEGTVERIELRALHLRTYDNRVVIIPNAEVFTSTVTSNTASPFRRREFVVAVSYANDLTRVIDVAREALAFTPGVLTEPPPDVLVDDLVVGLVNLRLRFYANSLRADYLQVGSACALNVKEAFEREGVAIGPGASVVELRGGGLPLPVGGQSTPEPPGPNPS